MTNMIAIVSAAINIILPAENSKDTDVSKSGATGRFQITQKVVTDVNRMYHKSYKLEDMKDPVKARNCATMFLTHQVKLGVKDPETLARIWAEGRTGALRYHRGYWYIARAALVGKQTRKVT